MLLSLVQYSSVGCKQVAYPIQRRQGMSDKARSIYEVIDAAKALAVEYKQLTGKPLGISGEVAEIEAHRLLGLELAPVRTPGYDAVRHPRELIQIKGRAVKVQHPRSGRVPRINLKHEFHSVLLVLIDESTMEPYEMWEAPRDRVSERLTAPGSKARNLRGSLGIAQFCTIAKRVWRSDLSVEIESAKRERLERKITARVSRRSARVDAFTPERRERWKKLVKDGPFNVWLRDQVQAPDGALDLEQLYAVARRWGINDRYDHLNPGMARMNIGNRLRAIVPREVYEPRFKPMVPCNDEGA